MPTDGPLPLHLGDHRRLGPDPEPLGDRYDVLLQREHASDFGRSAPRPRRPGDAHAAQRRTRRASRELALR